jgi:hypothetical protein
VKEFGTQKQFEKLINPKWAADEADGWEMTAISAYILKAQGAYRAPVDDSEKELSYMIFKNIRWSDSLLKA